MRYERGRLLAEGKTKKIWEALGSPKLVIVEHKNTITAFDDPARTKEFAKKAEYSTTTTCRIFELLRKQGIPVAYVEQVSPTEFVALKCEMIPLEVVARRYAVGGYLARHPELKTEDGAPPHRFLRPIAEFFLKTTGGKLTQHDTAGNERVLVKGLNAQRGEEDPLIKDPYCLFWSLYNPKRPECDREADLEKTIHMLDVIRGGLIRRLEDCLRDTFLILERAWCSHSYRLIDLKIEFGIADAVSDDNELVIADVIDNDSWRLRDQDWQEVSKEAFRQGEALDEIERKYGLVASLVEDF